MSGLETTRLPPGKDEVKLKPHTIYKDNLQIHEIFKYKEKKPIKTLKENINQFLSNIGRLKPFQLNSKGVKPKRKG